MNVRSKVSILEQQAFRLFGAFCIDCDHMIRNGETAPATSFELWEMKSGAVLLQVEWPAKEPLFRVCFDLDHAREVARALRDIGKSCPCGGEHEYSSGIGDQILQIIDGAADTKKRTHAAPEKTQ